jgi:hypothetical protein
MFEGREINSRGRQKLPLAKERASTNFVEALSLAGE